MDKHSHDHVRQRVEQSVLLLEDGVQPRLLKLGGHGEKAAFSHQYLLLTARVLWPGKINVVFPKSLAFGSMCRSRWRHSGESGTGQEMVGGQEQTHLRLSVS